MHALRLMGSGLFDAHPRLQIILGHMGEGLPFSMWRVDNANAWIENRHSWPAKKRLSDYFRENFYVTTSGNFHTPALYNTMLEIGADRIMFSTDWPFENIDHAASLVRCLPDQRERPPQDRAGERAAAVPVWGTEPDVSHKSTAAG